MDEETAAHWSILVSPPGAVWSGRARYAAAMHFYRRGEMDADVLEIFRYLARLDHEDPVTALRRYHIGEDWADRIEAARG